MRLWQICCVVLGAWVPSYAGQEPAAQPEPEPSWSQRLTLSGELRLRYEGFDWPGHFDDGRRDRFRYRFRVGLEGRVTDDLSVGLQVRSGDPRNPTSDNQSFDEGFSKKPLAVSGAWISWRPAAFLSVDAGKFSPTGQWSVSDFEWDDDTVVEGALEKLSWKREGRLARFDVSLYQYLLEESGSGGDAFMLGQQAVAVLALGAQHQLSVGAGFESVVHPERVTDLYFRGDLVSDAEHVTNLLDPATRVPVSDFRVGSAFLDWRGRALAGWPVRLTLFFYENFGASDRLGAILPASGGTALAEGRGADHSGAWFGRLQIGAYSKPGQVAVRLTRYDSGPDAVFFPYTQSDTVRGSNLDGYRVDVRVGAPGGSHFNLTGYRTRWRLGEDDTMNRWQLDYTVEF